MEIMNRKGQEMGSVPVSTVSKFVSEAFPIIDKDKSFSISQPELDTAAESIKLTNEQRAVSRLLLDTYQTVNRLAGEEFGNKRNEISANDLFVISAAIQEGSRQGRLNALTQALEENRRNYYETIIGTGIGCGGVVGISWPLASIALGSGAVLPILAIPAGAAIGAGLGYLCAQMKNSDEVSVDRPNSAKIVDFFK